MEHMSFKDDYILCLFVGGAVLDFCCCLFFFCCFFLGGVRVGLCCRRYCCFPQVLEIFQLPTRWSSDWVLGKRLGVFYFHRQPTVTQVVLESHVHETDFLKDEI